MSRDLLDRHVPGWATLSPMAFRHAIGLVDADLRPVLRAARDAVLDAVLDAVPVEPSPPNPPLRATSRKGK